MIAKRVTSDANDVAGQHRPHLTGAMLIIPQFTLIHPYLPLNHGAAARLHHCHRAPQ